MNKRIVSLILAVMFMFSFNINSYATEINNNLETATLEFRNQTVFDILTAIINKDKKYISENVSLFNSKTYEDMLNFIDNSNIANGEIGDMVVDIVTPNNSTTGDTVLMVNTKIWYNNQAYNQAYLFEFHINSSGDIYGFNIWAY